MKGVFFDTETSGLTTYAGAEILQTSIMGWDDGKRTEVVTNTFRMLGDPTQPSAVEALKINGYKYEEREKHPPLEAAFIKQLYDTIVQYDGIVLGCNPAFDWEMLTREGDRRGVPRPAGRVRLVDVSSIAVPMSVAGKISGISLRNMAALVGRPQQEPHDAGADIVLTCDVFEKLFEHYYKALVG